MVADRGMLTEANLELLESLELADGHPVEYIRDAALHPSAPHLACRVDDEDCVAVGHGTAPGVDHDACRRRGRED